MPKKNTPKAPAPATLLVELLTEELPPKALKRLSEAFAEALIADLRQDDFLTDASAVRVYSTPRRLAVQITSVLSKARDKEVEASGPSVKVGLDQEGKPTPALLGFAKKQGVDVSVLQRRETPKGEIFFYRALAKGSDLETNLDLKVGFALEKLPVPKIMRWGSGDNKFVRPVHGLLMMHGARVIQGEVMDVKSSNRTLGHRVLARNPIRLRSADEYERVLRNQGKIIASFAERRDEIVRQVAKAAGKAVPVAGDALLDEITALVETPAVLASRFSPDFLQVPPECLILSMQQHQRYIPLRDAGTGELLARFLFVANLQAADPRGIIRGNERVLRARLSDAKFFYDQDRKISLEARVPRLSDVVYHRKLGSQLERVERMRLLAGEIARQLGGDFLRAEHAAKLSKADLLTEMVGEFPELQGIMGRYYALHDGATQEVADAIEQHYRPRFSGDTLPVTPTDCSVALADKLVALTGLFGIQQVPTGDKDPFGLRRAALGIVRILVENKLALHLDTLIKTAFDTYSGQLAPANLLVRDFIYERFTSYLKDRGYTTIEIDSVLSNLPQRLDLVPQQLEAVRAFLALPEAESLAAANKRVDNILKQATVKGYSYDSTNKSDLSEPAEIALFEALSAISNRAKELFKNGDYTGYLKTFAALKMPVDMFFDKVTVMAEQEHLRRNRLALLNDLRQAMNRVADISKLAA